jgi:hypothetical protein
MILTFADYNRFFFTAEMVLWGMVPTHDDMFRYLDSLKSHGQSVHDKDSRKLATMFATTLHYPPMYTDAQIVAYAQWADEWKEQTRVGCV